MIRISQLILWTVVVIPVTTACQQPPSATAANYEDRLTKLEDDLRRLNEQYDGRLKQDQERITALEQRVTETLQKSAAELSKQQAAFSESIRDRMDRLIPIGTIIPYYGQLSALPDNWKVCDGSTVTDSASPIKGYVLPDLRQRFLRGAQENVADAKSGSMGGQDYVAGHTHNVSGNSSDVYFARDSVCEWLPGYNPVTNGDVDYDSSVFQITKAPGQSHDSHGHCGGTATFNGTAWAAGEHDNRPRYFSIPFVMRVK